MRLTNWQTRRIGDGSGASYMDAWIALLKYLPANLDYLHCEAVAGLWTSGA